MTQATPHFDQLVHWLQNSSASVLTSKRFLRWLDTLKAAQGWLVSGAVLLVLLVWNWQFVLSIGLGLVVLVWVYLARQGWWRLPQRDWQKLWNRANRSLTIATIGGVVTAIGSYVAIGIWRENHSWLATGIILEGLLSLSVVGLLLWQMIRQQASSSTGASGEPPSTLQADRQFSSAFASLAEADPLKRLVAVHQLTHLFTHSPASTDLPMSATHLADCFRLMLNRETEPLLCNALLEALHRLSPASQSAPQLKAAKSEVFLVEAIGQSKIQEALSQNSALDE